MDAIESLNKIRDEQLDAFFDDDSNELRPWQSKEWKENRSEVVKDVCEWCGDTDGPFHVHHTSNTPQWGREWIHASNEAFVTGSDTAEQYITERSECPSCGLRDYYERKTKSPTFRCNNCEAEFDEPKTLSGTEVVTDRNRQTKPYVKSGFYREKANWVANNRDAVRSVFQDTFDKLMTEYMELDETVTICQSCHFQEERTKNVRCSECEKQFHKPNKPMCWDCLVDEKGLQECDCDDGWYQPEKYDSCSDCR